MFSVNVVTRTFQPTLSFILKMEICYKRTYARKMSRVMKKVKMRIRFFHASLIYFCLPPFRRKAMGYSIRLSVVRFSLFVVPGL